MCPYAFKKTRGWQLISALTLLPVLFVLAACGSAIKTPIRFSDTGRVHLASTLAAQSEGSSIAAAKVTLARDGLTRTAFLTVADGLFTAEIAGLPVGNWTIEIEFYDPTGDVTHLATGSVRIQAESTVSTHLVAEPMEAYLELIVDLTGFPDADLVGNIRMTLHNDRILSLEPAESDPSLFRGVKSLPPGDYDFNVGLYTTSFYVSDRLYESPWQSVRLTAGKTTRVTWEAATGSAHIEADVVDLPPAPDALAVDTREDGLWLTWLPSQDLSVTTYRVYFRTDAFFPFELEGEVPAENPAWHMSEEPLDGPSEVWATVTAVTADGRESFRSVPLEITTMAP